MIRFRERCADCGHTVYTHIHTHTHTEYLRICKVMMVSIIMLSLSTVCVCVCVCVCVSAHARPWVFCHIVFVMLSWLEKKEKKSACLFLKGLIKNEITTIYPRTLVLCFPSLSVSYNTGHLWLKLNMCVSVYVCVSNTPGALLLLWSFMFLDRRFWSVQVQAAEAYRFLSRN